MKCPKCGAENALGATGCVQCKQALPMGNDPLLRMMLPVGRSGLETAAGYAGLFGVVVVPAPLALILGILAIVDLRKHPEKHGMGRAVFGTIIGVLGSGILI